VKFVDKKRVKIVMGRNMYTEKKIRDSGL